MYGTWEIGAGFVAHLMAEARTGICVSSPAAPCTTSPMSLETLPTELLFQIFALVSVEDILSLRCVGYPVYRPDRLVHTFTDVPSLVCRNTGPECLV